MTRDPFESFAYVQTGDYCVLASYAAALWPWLRVTPLSCFIAYCEHFGVAADPRCAEAKYLPDFIQRYSQPGMSGYRVVLDLHERSPHPLFARARSAVRATYEPDATSRAKSLESQLAGPTDRSLMVFINQSAFAGLRAMHSIAVIYDGGFWHFDANDGRLQRSAASLPALGALGEAILFEGLTSVAQTA